MEFNFKKQFRTHQSKIVQSSMPSQSYEQERVGDKKLFHSSRYQKSQNMKYQQLARDSKPNPNHLTTQNSTLFYNPTPHNQLTNSYQQKNIFNPNNYQNTVINQYSNKNYITTINRENSQDQPGLQLTKKSSNSNSLSCNYDPQEKLKDRLSEVVKDNRVLHQGIQCDQCKCLPISGPRYKCKICPDFDLCQACFHLRLHQHRQFQMKINCDLNSQQKQRTRLGIPFLPQHQYQPQFNIQHQRQQEAQQQFQPQNHPQPPQQSLMQEIVTQFTNLFR